MLTPPNADALIASALAEDLGVEPALLLPGGEGDPELLRRDATSWAVVPAGERFAGVVRARESGVVCGLPLVERTYAILAAAAHVGVPEVFPLVAEGAQVAAGESVAEIEGDARLVLAGERTALNLLQTLSGIATEARAWVSSAGGVTVLDTRKTLPGLRELSKYAVRVGGAANHRAGLYDMVLVKDNHLRRAGGVAEALGRARGGAPGLKVEIEADTIEQAREAAAAGADIVLLDNMDDATLALAVDAVREAADANGYVVLTEASGGISLERLAALAASGVDRVSSSAITLAAPLDFGFDEVEP